MKIYFELIILLNFLLDFMILYGTKRILKINKPLFRIVLGSIFGSGSSFLLFIKLSSIDLLFLKIVFSFLIIIISFGFKNIFINMFYFYIISIILGGSFYLLDINSNVYYTYILLVGLSFIIIYIFVLEISKYKETFKDKYMVNIYYKNKCFKLEGFIDTGNRMRSFIDNKPVILVNCNIKSDSYLYVPFTTLNNKGVIPCIKPDKVMINNYDLSNCLIGLVKDKFNLEEANCILPNVFKNRLEEIC